ncbi:MAG: hypothetical protein K1000chlam1_01561 [Candidatus Anoxychlamydiales bacterium]|nr:hypothetical protein [Candidatus Anoxychlamydiales bacterium]
MKKNNYELLIVSSPEREKVYCEIYYKGEILGEISQEQNKLLLEIYSYPVNQKWWQFSLEEFQEILEIGKKHLLGKMN